MKKKQLFILKPPRHVRRQNLYHMVAPRIGEHTCRLHPSKQQADLPWDSGKLAKNEDDELRNAQMHACRLSFMFG